MLRARRRDATLNGRPSRLNRMVPNVCALWPYCSSMLIKRVHTPGSKTHKQRSSMTKCCLAFVVMMSPALFSEKIGLIPSVFQALKAE